MFTSCYNLIANLGGVLLRFRMNPIARIADIKSAYLQTQLNPYDRDVIRFLWVKDKPKNVTSDNIQEFRFRRVIWGIISSAFLLAYTISYHLKRYNTPVSNDKSNNIYVDNLIKMAAEYYEETKALFNEASMAMCKWSSNSGSVMDIIKEEDRCGDDTLKVVGLVWKREMDSISTCKIMGTVILLPKERSPK